ncbi:MAG: universal stress protein [Aerococcus sp.]|nr:universal stress protein [Aerococcus sp.]
MTLSFHSILVGVDDSPDALFAFRTAIDIAKESQAKLTIVSVLESDTMNVYQALDKDYIHGERAALEKHLKDYVQTAKDAGIYHVQAVVGEGDPGKTIARDIIPALNPDLLVIGAKAQNGVAKYFGSQAAYMAQYAGISVFIARDPNSTPDPHPLHQKGD